VHLDADPKFTLYRLYTHCGVDRQGEGQSYLQVLASGDDIRDVAYYQFLNRQIPVTEEEQAPFRGQGYGLGDIDFWMGDEQLAEAGYSADAIAALFGGADALNFKRDTPGGNYVAPFTGSETRLDDAIGDLGLKKSLSFAPYARQLAGGAEERLLISFEVVETMDGQPTQQLHVDFMVGLALDRQKIKIL